MKNDAIEIIRKKLFELQDLKYKEFQSRLVPNINPDKIIGIRTPALRFLAKIFSDTEEAAVFLSSLPHEYYEENNLHAFLIERINDYDECISEINSLLPFVDNWATCDSMRPKIFKKHLPELEKQAYQWIDSGETYTVRYGIECLMTYFLDSGFRIEHAEKIAATDCGEYYVSMMVAWYFATALAKQYDAVFPFLEQRKLDPETHRRTVQKAVDSFRITDEQKLILKSLR